MSKEKKPGKKRGSKGGIKHQPGKGHDRKSLPAKKKRFSKKAAKKMKQQEEDARREWEKWDALPTDVKKLLGPTEEPKLPRPRNDK